MYSIRFRADNQPVLAHVSFPARFGLHLGESDKLARIEVDFDADLFAPAVCNRNSLRHRARRSRLGVTHECDFPADAATKPALIRPRVDPHASPADIYGRLGSQIIARGESIYAVDGNNR